MTETQKSGRIRENVRGALMTETRSQEDLSASTLIIASL